MTKLIQAAIAFVTLLPLHAAVLPSGTKLEVRLTRHVGSRVSHVGEPVEALLIAPVYEGNALLVPAGTSVSGRIEHIDRLGLGLRHTVARLDLHFTRLTLATGESTPIDARVYSVDTAREAVRSDGAIIGINPTANFSTGVSAVFTLLYLGEHGLRLPVLGFKFLAARSPDAEIFFPAGTDLVVTSMEAVGLPALPAAKPAIATFHAGEIADVEGILANLPIQQTAGGGNRPSDLVNVLILGDTDQVNRSFKAAGWSGAERRGVMALYRMFHCTVERRGYSSAPMNNLTLDGRAPSAAFQKSLDTFAKRHHIRLWHDQRSGAWLGAATEDVSYAFSHGHLTHATDRRIDNERAKVVNDLAYTGCIDKGTLIPRNSFTPVQDKRRKILTDGDIAVLRLNDCLAPRSQPAEPYKPKPVRAIRAAYAFGVDLARSNPLSVGYALAKSLIDNSKIRDTDRLQATRVFVRPSAIVSATLVHSGGPTSGR